MISCSPSSADPFRPWDLPKLTRDFARDSVVAIPACTKQPGMYVAEMARLPAKSHSINDPVLSKNQYKGYVPHETGATQLYQDFYHGDWLINRISRIVGRPLRRTPLVTQWIPAQLNGRIHKYATTRDGQGPHFDRRNYQGNIYTVVYTIYGEPGKTQTLRCWPKGATAENSRDIELVTNSLTIHKCADVLHQVLPCFAEMKNETGRKEANTVAPIRFCAIFQFTDDPRPSTNDILWNPVKTAAARTRIAANVHAVAVKGALVSACGCNDQSRWIWVGALVTFLLALLGWGKLRNK